MQVLHQLPSLTWSAGGSQTVQLRDLPKQVRGRIPHVVGFLFDVNATPTFTTSPTVVGMNNIVSQCDFWDGHMMRFQGGFNTLRYREIIETGCLRTPDPLTSGATNVARPFRRFMAVGPTNTIGGEADFMIPTGSLLGAELRLKYGILTDVSVNTTALTATIRVFALLELADEVRIPPAYQWAQFTAGAPDLTIPGRALYHTVAMFDSVAFGDFTPGDIGSVRLDLGAGDVVPTIPAQALTASYQWEYACGTVGAFGGDPLSAVDFNQRVVNTASPTALAQGPSDCQLVLWSALGQKLSKLELAETSGRLQWNGTQQTAVVCIGRILAQPQNVVGTLASESLQAINRPMRSIKAKTISKQQYKGPFVEFMPYTVKV